MTSEVPARKEAPPFSCPAHVCTGTVPAPFSGLRSKPLLDFYAAGHATRIKDIGGMSARPVIDAGTKIESNNWERIWHLPDLQGLEN